MDFDSPAPGQRRGTEFRFTLPAARVAATGSVETPQLQNSL